MDKEAVDAALFNDWSKLTVAVSGKVSIGNCDRTAMIRTN
jgi:hypothetical protein